MSKMYVERSYNYGREFSSFFFNLTFPILMEDNWEKGIERGKSTNQTGKNKTNSFSGVSKDEEWECWGGGGGRDEEEEREKKIKYMAPIYEKLNNTENYVNIIWEGFFSLNRFLRIQTWPIPMTMMASVSPTAQRSTRSLRSSARFLPWDSLSLWWVW